MSGGALELRALPGIGEVEAGTDLGAVICEAAVGAGIGIADDSAVVVSHKIVSKSEGRVADLAAVEPGDRATELAERVGKDPRLVELILDESAAIVRAEPGVLIVETRSGWICANAGIDGSNVPGAETVVFLPADPDRSARRIRGELAAACGRRPAVVVADSFGRPWRLGQAEVAIGCAGLRPIDDWRGRKDVHGRELLATTIAIADQLAGAADLARDKTSATPVVIVSGADRWRTDEDGPGAAALQRPGAEDLFR